MPTLTDAGVLFPLSSGSLPTLLIIFFSLDHSAHSSVLLSTCHCYLSFYFLLKEKHIDQIDLTSPTTLQGTPQMKILSSFSSAYLPFPPYCPHHFTEVLNNETLFKTYPNFLPKVALNITLTALRNSISPQTCTFHPPLIFWPSLKFNSVTQNKS